MDAHCPSCSYAFSRPERGRFFGANPWKPHPAPCPECGAQLRWVAWAWRLQALAFIAVLFCVFRVFPPPVRAAAGGIALISIVAALLGLRLVKAEE